MIHKETFQRFHRKHSDHVIKPEDDFEPENVNEISIP